MHAFQRAAALTERVDIQLRVELFGYGAVNNLIGGYGHLWWTEEGEPETSGDNWHTAVTRVWAELVPITGKEFQAAQSTRPSVPVRWRMRYRPDLARLDTRITRILHGGSIYNVTYIEDVHNAHVELYIVTERADP